MLFGRPGAEAVAWWRGEGQAVQPLPRRTRYLDAEGRGRVHSRVQVRGWDPHPKAQVLGVQV